MSLLDLTVFSLDATFFFDLVIFSSTPEDEEFNNALPSRGSNHLRTDQHPVVYDAVDRNWAMSGSSWPDKPDPFRFAHGHLMLETCLCVPVGGGGGAVAPPETASISFPSRTRNVAMSLLGLTSFLDSTFFFDLIIFLTPGNEKCNNALPSRGSNHLRTDHILLV